MELIIKEAGARLDKALADLTDLSRSQANDEIKKGTVLVNGKAVKAKYAVKVGDVVTYEVPEEEVLEYKAENIPLDIVYEDEDTVRHALNPKSWTIWQYWSDENPPIDPLSEEDSLASFLDSSEDFHLALHYPVNDDYTYEYIDKKDIKQVFWIGMPDYDTAYRIFIFHTKDNKLILGQNEPD